MAVLKNRNDILVQLVNILMDFDKQSNNYQTDVYLYYNIDTETAELDTFINVGGNSWLNNDHYSIYSDMPHEDDWSNFYCNRGEFAEALNIPYSTFNTEVIDFLNITDEEDYEVEWYDEYKYIISREDYTNTLISIYYTYIDDMKVEYEEKAEYIISTWEKENLT